MSTKTDLEALKLGILAVLNNQGIIISVLATIAGSPMSEELISHAKVILELVEKDTLKLKG